MYDEFIIKHILLKTYFRSLLFRFVLIIVVISGLGEGGGEGRGGRECSWVLSVQFLLLKTSST